MKESFSARLSKALKYRGIKQTELAQKSGIYRGTINNYVNGKYEAKQLNLMKIAKVLNVSETWLMGFDVPMEENDQSTSFINNVDNEKIILMGKINSKINLLEYNQLEFINTMLDYLPNIDSNNTDSILTYIKFLKSSK